jgi:hypothetical protein
MAKREPDRMVAIFVNVPGQPPLQIGVCSGFNYTYEGSAEGDGDLSTGWEVTFHNPNPELLTALGWTFPPGREPSTEEIPARTPPPDRIQP